MKRLLLFCLFFFSSVVVASTAHVPPGFEQAVEEQELLSEVVFMGTSLGLQTIKLSSQTFTFLEPDAVFAQLQKTFSVKPDAVTALKQFLLKPLDRNDAQACSQTARLPGCDYLQSQQVAGIYNDANARILLFANPAFFDTGEGVRYFTPTASNTQNGYVQQQTFNYLYSEDYSTAYLAAVGALGVSDNSYWVLDWDATRTENKSTAYVDNALSINGLYYRHDYSPDLYGQLGKMGASDLSSKLGGSFAFSFFPALNLEGARLGKTFAYENTAANAQTQPLRVVLVSPARVDVYKAGKLLSTNYLRAGSNAISTDQFPPGDYPVLLKIYEGDRLVRTEEAKVNVSRGRVTGNQSAWFLQAGKIDAQYHSGYGSDAWAAQSGYGVAWRDDYYLSAALGTQPQSTYAELAVEFNKGIDWLKSDLNLKYTYFLDTEHARGDAQRIGLTSQGVSLNMARDNLLSPACDQVKAWQPEYFGCFETLSAYLGFTLDNLSISAGYTRSFNPANTFDPTPSTTTFSPNRATENYQLMLNRNYTLGDCNLLLGAGVFRDVGLYDTKAADQGLFLSLTLSANQPNNLDLSLSTRYEHGNLSGTVSNTDLQLRKQWDDQTKDLTVNASQYKASQSSEKSNSLNVAGEARASHGKYYAALSQTVTSSGSTQQRFSTLSGSYASTLAVTASGIDLGPYGQGQPSGAILAQSSGNDGSSEFALSASGYRANVTSGQNALLPVTQYQRTVVDVRPLIADENSRFDQAFDDGDAELFLLPGKVNQRHVYTQRTVFIFINQFTGRGKPISPVKFLDVESSSSYAEGRAAIEVKTGQKSLGVVDEQNNTWRCPIPAADTQQVNLIEALTCDALPK